MSPLERFAANLRRARQRAEITQEQLADRCGLHRTEISLLERAGREPRLETLARLCGALGIDATELFDGVAWEPQGAVFEIEPAPPAG